jgi:hypothetical protein
MVRAFWSALTFFALAPCPLMAAASLDVTVEGGETSIVVYSGTADVCDNSNNCIPVEAGCGVAVVGQGVAAIGDSAKPEFVAEKFPLATDQEVLEQDFRVGTSECGLEVIPAKLRITPDEPGAIPPVSASPG